MTDAGNPRLFFDAFVKRSYDEWLDAPTDLLRASCVVHQAHIMLERLVQYETRNSPEQFEPKIKERRKSLAKENFDFALLRDIDNAHKHLVD